MPVGSWVNSEERSNKVTDIFVMSTHYWCVNHVSLSFSLVFVVGSGIFWDNVC